MEDRLYVMKLAHNDFLKRIYKKNEAETTLCTLPPAL